MTEDALPIIGKTKRQVKIAVALVSHDNVPVTFAYDLANLAAFSMQMLPDDVLFGVNLQPGTYVHAGRQDMLESLLADGVTHILWIDTDMRFPRDALVRLLQHNKPLVGINYSTRGVPPDFVAIKHAAYEAGQKSERLRTLDASTGLESVDAIGFGLVLMRADACNNLPDLKDQPWFGFDWLGDRRQWVGEDVFFCRLLKSTGIDILVDHDLSKECKHTGQYEYTLEHVANYKAIIEQQEKEAAV